jgi:glycosyltransferase involved in cell wall biosynthesis
MCIQAARRAFEGNTLPPGMLDGSPSDRGVTVRMTMLADVELQPRAATSRPAALVDVLIPVFNVATTIAASIASIRAQTILDLRIIVVDDGSTDDTADILRALAAADDRITVITQKNAGIVDALNAGLESCTAEFVARHDGDDLADSDRFERQIAYLRAHPDCMAVSGAVRLINGAGQPLGQVVHLGSTTLADLHSYPQREPYLMHPFLMARRAAIVAVGKYRHVFHAEDTDLYWRLQEIGGLTNMPDVLGTYRLHAASITGYGPLNGRISALNSQLAGISALRRRCGREDLAFPREALAAYRLAGSLRAIIELGCRSLDPEEARKLRVSTCAKLLELASYRPYELDAADCDCIRDILVPALDWMPQASRSICIRMISGTAARLLAAGRLRSAWHLVPPRYLGHVLARLVFRAVATRAVRWQVREAFGRAGFVK